MRKTGRLWRWAPGVFGLAAFGLAAGCAYIPPAAQSRAADQSCVQAGRVLNAGFYAYFAPVSYSADEDPDAAAFSTHLGYEADLLTALEAIDGAGFSFARRPIAVWDDIWLQASEPHYDIIGGGITILDSRTLDAAGRKAVLFTAGHVAFRQSLLVRAEDESRLAAYADLTSAVRVGALAGTTGEFRLLQLVGLVDRDGVLAAGARVETPAGEIVADGGPDYIITAAGESDSLAGRRHLHPPADNMPQIVYLGDETGETALFDALADGRIDAIARGEIGNRETAHARGGEFIVTALDEAVEYGGFALAAQDAELAACLDRMLDWLTDSRAIGYAEWRQDPDVFMRRAELWNGEERGQRSEE